MISAYYKSCPPVGADVNLRSYEGVSPLLWASARSADGLIAKILFKGSGNFDVLNNVKLQFQSVCQCMLVILFIYIHRRVKRRYTR